MYTFRVIATSTKLEGSNVDAFLAHVHGVRYDADGEESSCAFWLIDARELSSVRAKVRGGYLSFEAALRRIRTTVDYEVLEPLSPDEQSHLVEYTIGQLLDGIGENASNDLLRDFGIDVQLVGDPIEAHVSVEEIAGQE